MNYQSVEKLQSKFKLNKGGWEVFDDGGCIVAVNNFWKVEVESFGSRFDDGDGYPYINLSLRLGQEGYTKYVCSFSKLKNCIEYIKQYGVV